MRMNAKYPKLCCCDAFCCFYKLKTHSYVSVARSGKKELGAVLSSPLPHPLLPSEADGRMAQHRNYRNQRGSTARHRHAAVIESESCQHCCIARVPGHAGPGT